MNDGRLKNSVRNVLGALINKATAIVFPFVIRTIILYYLGTEYAGLSSLFTSVLQILSLSELGIGSAIVFSMYKPVAEGNNAEINALLKLYRKFYYIIGVTILFVGIILIPMIPRLINGTYPNDINLYALYLIYLSNTVLSYFLFAYKTSILNAFQRSDIESNLTTLINTGMYIFQIITLIAFRNYYLYIIWLPIATIVINIVRSRIVNKQYPAIRCDGEVSQEVKHDIFKRVGALIGHQLSGTVNCSLDNIVVSAFLGLKVVAQYGNYYYVVSALSGVMQVYNDTSGNAYEVIYYSDGTVKTLYNGQFVDGTFNDSTGNAWDISYSEKEGVYIYNKGIFKNNYATDTVESEPVDLNRINKIIDGKKYDCELKWR